MRSFAFTLLLVFLAVVLGGLSFWRISKGNLDSVFGAPPVAVGDPLYTNFKPDDVHRIILSGNGVEAEFEHTGHGWQVIRPWNDRMDIRAANAIVGFTLGTKVADVVPERKIDSQQAGLQDGLIGVRLESKDGRRLAKYILGRRTPWIAKDTAAGDDVPTVYVRQNDIGRKNYIYACTGDIHPLFKNGFAYLRDHQPLFFNPLSVRKVRIKGPEGELVLAKDAPDAPWHIIKPLSLSTDRDAVKRLLEGLFQLRALKVSDVSSVTRPANGETTGNRQIAIQTFGTDQETVLDIQPPATADARTALATVSDRPTAVFELPLKPEADLLSLAQLPLTVNELRDTTLTHLRVAQLQSIRITSANHEPVIVGHPSKDPKSPWMLFTADGKSQPASEKAVFDILKAVTEDKVAGFVTDAATDLTPWGLDRPIITLTFLGFDNAVIELLIARGKDGTIYASRRGSLSVVKLDETTLSKIATLPYQWRQPRLWSLNRVDLLGIERVSINRPPVLLRYSFLDESWKAESAGKDVTAQINPDRANYLLTALENLQVTRWLGTDDSEAAARLVSPPLVISVLCKHVNDNGGIADVARGELRIAPVSDSPDNRFYYGRLTSEPNYFLIDRPTALKLTVDLSSEEP
jgi:hypothetical protein